MERAEDRAAGAGVHHSRSDISRRPGGGGTAGSPQPRQRTTKAKAARQISGPVFILAPMGSNPLDRFERFQVTSHSPFQDFSCRKGGLCEAALRGPAQVLDYVGRYTHRVAISNNRLVSMDDGKVC